MTPAPATLEGSSSAALETRPTTDLAGEVIDQRRRSYDWLSVNYWPEWIRAFKNYKCNTDPHKDDNDPTKDDLTQTAIGMPDTWSLVRRQVARVTAQLPNLKFRADAPEIADRISRALMYQWDKGGVQRVQKRHVTQAAIFGWSVRPWWWDLDERTRKRRIDPFKPDLDPAMQTAFSDQYGQRIQELAIQEGVQQPEAVAKLIAEYGRGGMLPVEYQFKNYEGPRSDFLFIGDCFPEPNFDRIQTSNWFIVQRRRNREWLDKLVRAYPELAKGVSDLIAMHPQGSPRSSQGRIPQELRMELLAAADRKDELLSTDATTGSSGTKEWTIIERHKPGVSPKLAYVGESGVWIGEIDYPFDLEGKIAFTELIFIDDLLAGVGDSNPRIIRGLQELHTRNANQRSDLVDKLLRPIYGTSDQRLFDNPDQMQRGKGFSVVLTKGPGTLWVLNEGPALASAAASGSAEEGALMRQMQMATGENNMSQAANVDPQQARTATGARIMAYNGDILAKDQIDMYTVCVRDDVEMMYLLNRSELSAPISFDKNQYARHYIGAAPDQQQQQTPEMMTATPEDFQYDGEIEVEVGSTLADDDDANLAKAQNIFQAAVTNPELFNVEKARNDYLIAMGKGRDLQAYIPPPQPPPPPPEVKSNAAVSVRFEMLVPPVQFKILNDAYPGAGLTPEDFAPPQIPGMPPAPPQTSAPGVSQGAAPGMPAPGGPPSPGPGGPTPQMAPLPQMMPPEQLLGASALDAARGRSPLRA